MSNNLIVAGKESELLKQQELKAESEINNLKKELSDCKAEKEDLRGKLKMALTELDSATASIKRMNTGSKKLDEILGSQKIDKSKSGIWYTHGASSSKDKGKSVFVQGPTVYSMTHIVHPPLKSVNAMNVHEPKFTPTCHFCGIKRHIRPHCNKRRNHIRNQTRKKPSSPQQVKTKAIWIHKTDLSYNVVYTRMSKSIENAEVDPPPRKLLGIGLHP